MVGQIYPTEHKIRHIPLTKTPFFDLDWSITNDIVSSKIYDTWG